MFTGNYNTVADGVSLTLNRLVAYLEKQGHEVMVFGPSTRNPALKHVGTFIPVPSIPMVVQNRQEYRIPLLPSRKAWKALKEFKPDLVHLATPDMLGRAALFYAKRAKIPALASYHTHFSSYLGYYRMAWLTPAIWGLMRRFYANCEKVLVPSASMLDVLRAQGIRKGLEVWEHGVELARFNPHKRSLEWRRAMGIQDEEVLVTFVSRLVWEKGLDVYLDVIQKLEEAGIPHKSLIVGDGPIAAELQAKLPNTLFTGHLKGDALARAYASSEVFLFPSATETFGLVTLEAMAAGLPAVCADATGSRELVDHGRTGFLAPPQDPAAFYQYTAQLVQDAGLRSRMQEGALDKARAYDWDQIMSKIEVHYDAVLTDWKRGNK